MQSTTEVEMTRSRRLLVVGGAALTLGAGLAGVGWTVGGDDGDENVTGPAADRARTAALALIPGGRVNAVERDSEEGATWEVEVRRPDGKTVDVRLDANYKRVGVQGDSEERGDSD
jgi:Peptidase propeptide and YPEB domain